MKLHIPVNQCSFKYTFAQSPTSLQRGKTLANKCPGYDIKQSDGEVPVILKLSGMWSTPFIAIAPRSTQTRSGSIW